MQVIVKKRKKQQNQPNSNQPCKKQTNHPFVALVGREVVIQARGGVIYSGTLDLFQNGFLRLKDAKVRGKNCTAQVDFVFVSQSIIQHIHPAPVKLCEKEKKNDTARTAYFA